VEVGGHEDRAAAVGGVVVVVDDGDCFENADV